MLAGVASLSFASFPGPADASASGDLAAAQKRANAAAARLSRAESALARVEASVRDLERRAEDARRRLAGLERGVKESAIRQYVNGGARLPALVGTDLAASVRANELARFVTQGAVADLDRYRAARDDLAAAAGALEHERARQRSVLAELRRQRAAALAEVTRLARLQRELEARAARARARGGRAARAAVLVGGGGWVCPVAGPRAFSNDWGAPRSGGRRHQGTDLIAPYGTPVVAPVAGTVSQRSGGLGGLAFWLAGRDGNTYYGAHLSRFGASGPVAAGTVIGYVGTSGNARGGPPHLHFEIHPGGGRAVNPYPTLVKYC